MGRKHATRPLPSVPQPPTNIPATPAMSPTSPSGRASAAGVAPPPGARLARFTHKVA